MNRAYNNNPQMSQSSSLPTHHHNSSWMNQTAQHHQHHSQPWNRAIPNRGTHPSYNHNYSIHSNREWAPMVHRPSLPTPTRAPAQMPAPLRSVAPAMAGLPRSAGCQHGMRTPILFPGAHPSRDHALAAHQPELGAPRPTLPSLSSLSNLMLPYNQQRGSTVLPPLQIQPPAHHQPVQEPTHASHSHVPQNVATHFHLEPFTQVPFENRPPRTPVAQVPRAVITFLPPNVIPDPEIPHTPEQEEPMTEDENNPQPFNRHPSPVNDGFQQPLNNPSSNQSTAGNYDGNVDSNLEDHGVNEEDTGEPNRGESPSHEPESPPSPQLSSLSFSSEDDDSDAAGPYVQKVKKNKKRSPAQQETLRIGRELAKAREAAFMEEFAKLEASRELEDAALATKHGIAPSLISKMKFGKPLKGTRAVNAENAKVSDLAKRLNTGLETNHRYSLPQLKQMVKDDPRYQNLSEEQEKELVKRLEIKRGKQKTGLRPSALSASQDVSANIKSFHDQLMTMNERTEIAAVCLFARSSMSQSYAPRWIATPSAMDFAQDAFGQTMWDATRGLEVWSVTKKKNKPAVSFLLLRSECARVITGSLESITGTKGVRMVYKNYEDQIVSKLGVKLVGWTYKEFVNPSEITGIDDLKTLHEALTTGACHWVRLSKAQLTAHVKNLATRRAAGEVIGTKRKVRVDKGVTKGPRAGKSNDNDDDNDADLDEGGRPGGSKRQKTTARPALNNVTNNKQSTKPVGSKAAAKQTTSHKQVNNAKAQLPPQPRHVLSSEFVDSDSGSEDSVVDDV